MIITIKVDCGGRATPQAVFEALDGLAWRIQRLDNIAGVTTALDYAARRDSLTERTIAAVSGVKP